MASQRAAESIAEAVANPAVEKIRANADPERARIEATL